MIQRTIGNRQLLVVPIMAALVVGTQIQTHSTFAFENQSLIIKAIGKKDLEHIISQKVSDYSYSYGSPGPQQGRR